MRKPQANSKLKTLPEDVQARIADWCAQDSLESAVRRCALELSPPVLTQTASMSGFFSWWQKEQERKARVETIGQLFRRADANAKAVSEMLAQTGATEDQIARADQLVFTLQASSTEDKELFIELEKLRLLRETAAHKARMDLARLKQKDKDLALAERRVALLEKKMNEAKDALGDGSLTTEQREKRMRQIFGVQ